MKFEKSCGGVIFREKNGRIEYLLIFNKKGSSSGHWGFPKGHVEANETEHETAAREIKEEANVTVEFIDGFREVSTYSPKQNVMKDVVYFLARAKTDNVVLQQSEVADYAWKPYGEAHKTLHNDRVILQKANDFLESKIKKQPVLQ
jgi:bis(5'-nucleosidyl)-tetraphosphatase